MAIQTFGSKEFQVALCGDAANELFSILVSVDCYTPARALPGDMAAMRVEMWRASEMAMSNYQRHCRNNEMEVQPIKTMIITAV